MTKRQLIDWALAHGWTQDRFGHLQRITQDLSAVTYRLKLSSIAVRYETKVGASWVRLRSAYYSKLSVSAEGKVVGMHTGHPGFAPGKTSELC